MRRRIRRRRNARKATLDFTSSVRIDDWFDYERLTSYLSYSIVSRQEFPGTTKTLTHHESGKQHQVVAISHEYWFSGEW